MCIAYAVVPELFADLLFNSKCLKFFYSSTWNNHLNVFEHYSLMERLVQINLKPIGVNKKHSRDYVSLFTSQILNRIKKICKF